MKKIIVNHGNKFHYFSRKCSKCREIEYNQPKYIRVTKSLLNKIKDFLKHK